MYYGLHVASCGGYADARALAELAQQAEAAKWDGFFIWDYLAMSPPQPQVGPWIALATIALATMRIRTGTMITPLASWPRSPRQALPGGWSRPIAGGAHSTRCARASCKALPT